MTKNKIIYTCNSCATTYTRQPMGKCASCGDFQNFSETNAQPTAQTGGSQAGLKSSGPVRPNRKALTIDALNSKPIERLATGIGEFDRVLGGGFVAGEVVMLAASPGAGKALRDDTLIPLANGEIKPLKEINIGDVLIDVDSQATTVLSKFHPVINKAYKVFFSDGTIINACEDHLWSLHDLRTRPHGPYTTNEMVNKTTSELFTEGVDYVLKNSSNKLARWGLPTITYNEPQDYETKDYSTGDTVDGFITENEELNYITGIVETNASGNYQCIMVDSPSHTFLCTENLIPTHNSTLSMSIADKFAILGKTVLYVSGEESEHQIGLRAKRMGVSSPLIKIINETNIEIIMGHVEEEKPELLIIDSLQTMASTNLAGSLGSIQQSKEAASAFTLMAKRDNIITILISQVTKE